MTTDFTTYNFLATGASLRRTMPDYLVDTINVKDYGAVGDGITDDFDAIMAALSWNSIFVTAAQTAYTGAVRFTSQTVAAGIVTAKVGVPGSPGNEHGLTTGDIILAENTFSTPFGYNGVVTVTVTSPTEFTYSAPGPEQPGLMAYPGYFTPNIASATWSSGTVTVSFDAPHRFPLSESHPVIIFYFDKNTVMTVSGAASGTAGVIRLTVNSTASTQTGETVAVAGVGGSGGGSGVADGSHVATVVDGTHLELQGTTFTSGYTNGTVTNNTRFYGVTKTVTVASNPRQLTFPLTGSGTLQIFSGFTKIQGPSLLDVVSWPGIPSFAHGVNKFAYYMAEVAPVNYAGNYFQGQLTAVTPESPPAAATLQFGGANSVFWGDINAGDLVRLSTPNIGKYYFPPGTYKISAPLRLPAVGASGVISGGPATIHGSFPDFLFSLNQKAAGEAPLYIEKLTFINDDAAGSGLQFDSARGGVVGCTFKAAAVGLILSSIAFRDSTSYGVDVTGCFFFPSSGATDAIGLACTANNGRVAGNYFNGLKNGISDGEFDHVIEGNLFVDCETGINGARNPTIEGGATISTADTIRGNAFQNCGKAITSSGSFGFVRIEGTYISGGADSDYGLALVTGGSSGFGNGIGLGLIRGMFVTGTFATTAVNLSLTNRATYRSIGAENSGAGAAWGFPAANQPQVTIDNCNTSLVWVYADLEGRAITGLAYNSGTGVVTLTPDIAGDLAGLISVKGVKVGGSLNNSYNGIFTPLSTSPITYHVNVAPGTADSNTGSVVNAITSTTTKPIKAIAWSTGTVTVETLGPHGVVPFTGTATVAAVVGGGFSNGYTGTFDVTVVDSTHFTYPVVSNPGTVDMSSLSPSVPSYPNVPGSRMATYPCMLGAAFAATEGLSRANISNGQKLGGGTALIGDIVTGGGSQRVSVAWMANGWIRRG